MLGPCFSCMRHGKGCLVVFCNFVTDNVGHHEGTNQRKTTSPRFRQNTGAYIAYITCDVCDVAFIAGNKYAMSHRVQQQHSIIVHHGQLGLSLAFPPFYAWGWILVSTECRPKWRLFDSTLFILSASLFSPYDILQVPINLGSRESTYFCEIYQV